jgi:hypothetical protein
MFIMAEGFFFCVEYSEAWEKGRRYSNKKDGEDKSRDKMFAHRG